MSRIISDIDKRGTVGLTLAFGENKFGIRIGLLVFCGAYFMVGSF